MDHAPMHLEYGPRGRDGWPVFMDRVAKCWVVKRVSRALGRGPLCLVAARELLFMAGGRRPACLAPESLSYEAMYAVAHQALVQAGAVETWVKPGRRLAYGNPEED